MTDLPLLPTTMVGSYPRPLWYRDQLEGRDVLEAWKIQAKQEAYVDAVRTVITDQQVAGLDLVADGQLWFDDYGMGIGSFLWYWFERIGGFGREKREHPASSKARGRDAWALDETGGVALIGPIERGPVRLRQLYEIAAAAAERAVKACVGAGPAQLSTMAHFEGGPISDRYELSYALAEVFAAEIDDLVAAGCRHIQLEDLGARMPNLSGPKDFACRDMADVGVLADLPRDKGIAAGVIDVRSLEVEAPEQVAERIRAVLKHVPAERVALTTDCGMKQLPRPCARQKLKALAAGAAIVRAELTGAA